MDGKVANQRPRGKWILNCVPVAVKCGNCSKILCAPTSAEVIGFKFQQVFQAYSYLGSKYFIYDTKSGRSICYCSDYCRKQHNHRFRVDK
jgi:hypothetical protein